MNVEIDRLTLLINRYKEKLNRRETANRDLLVELQQYKTWKQQYQELNQKYNLALQEAEKERQKSSAEIKRL